MATNPINTLLDYRATFRDQVPQHCNRRLDQGSVVNFRTGELTPHHCGANGCAYCVRLKTRAVSRAVGASDPDVMMTLTKVGDEWPLIRARMNQLRKILKRSGFPFEWAYVVECNWTEQHHFHHAHALAHGVVPDGETLRTHAVRVGMGSVSQTGTLRSAEAASRYLFKKETRYALHLPHTLWINGDQLIHASRGYWRVNDQPVAGMDRAIQATRPA